MESVWRQTGTKPEGLHEDPILLDICNDAWNAFIRLHNSKAASMGGFTPIQYSEIFYYSKVYQIEFDTWELEMIRLFDRIAKEAFEQQAEKEKQAAEAKAKVQQK